MLIIVGVIYFTPLHYYNVYPKYYTYGLGTNLIFYSFLILFPIWIGRCIYSTRNNKLNSNSSVNNRIYLFLIGSVLVASAGGLTQFVDRSILILTSAHTITLTLIYFTIENPDLRMVDELTKNRKLTEDNFEEKSNFLFKVSQDLKEPLKEIVDMSQEIVNNNNVEENALEINLNSRQLYSYVNSAIDVSQIDIKNLKLFDTIYNSKNFFDEIGSRVKTEIKNSGKDIEFRFDISKTLPRYLSGDNTKLKQIILSILFNSIKHTDNGFVELSVNTIVKYGVCRLMIEISDCGGGMSLDKINRVLNISGELTKSDIDKINSLSIDLSLVHKMIKVLNGNFIVKSEKDLGTSFLVIIDQKIESKKKDDVDSYLKTGNKILLISDDDDLFNKIKNKLSVDVEQSLYLRDALEKLDNKDIKCILIDNKLKEMNGLGVLKKLNTDIPSIIIIGENEKFLGKHFVEDGFNNFIIKEFIDDELSKIDEFM
jgi:signal transduction histidine kinase